MIEINECCKESFKNHKATLIQDTDRFLIIDWRNANGSSNYYVNYIVDKKRGSLIVSGDLGDSIATWYNPIEPSKLKVYIRSIDYYISKFQCSSDDYNHKPDDIVSDLRGQLEEDDVQEFINTDDEFDTVEEFWEYIDDEVSLSIYGKEFIPSENLRNIIEKIHCDSWEWLHDCGQRVDMRVHLWSVGFNMACEQLGI